MQNAAMLEFLPVVVVAMKPPNSQPAIAAGFVGDSPVGPAVAMVVSCALPGQPGLAFAAHLHPDEADALVERLQKASAKAREALQGSPDLRIGPEIAQAALAEWERQGADSEEPAVVAIADGQAQPDMLEGEAIGLQIQVQHGGDAKPTGLAGALAFVAHQVPPDGRPVIGIHLQHGDGSAMTGILEEEQLVPATALLREAMEGFAAIQDGSAPEGVKPS